MNRSNNMHLAVQYVFAQKLLLRKRIKNVTVGPENQHWLKQSRENGALISHIYITTDITINVTIDGITIAIAVAIAVAITNAIIIVETITIVEAIVITIAIKHMCAHIVRVHLLSEVLVR